VRSKNFLLGRVGRVDEETRRKSLGYSIKDGVAWSVNSGLGNSYVTPYALKVLQANDAQIGFLTSVPNLVANLSQIETPNLMEKVSRKKIVTTCVLIQALTWLPISLVGVLFLYLSINGAIAPALLILFYTFYLTLGSFISPAWSSWMGDLVPKGERGRFFGMRNRIINVAGLISMLLGAVFLDAFGKVNLVLAFISLFVAAMAARLISWYFLNKQYEPVFRYEHKYYFTFLSFVRRMKDNNFGRFTLYATLMALAVNLAAPFFAVYMLRELGFSYLAFILVTMSASLSQMLFMPVWGRFSDRYGNLVVLKICGLLIPTIPLLWFFSTNFNYPFNLAYLIAVEGTGGFFWAGFNLASTNFIYDAVSRQRRGLCFAYFGALNGVGVFVGATLGGLFASYLLTSLLLLFLISGGLRLAVSLLMLPKLREVRRVKHMRPLWYYMGDFIRRRLPLHSH
jgi:MFS family permease